MLYRATRWKLSSQDLQAFKQGMVSLSRRRTFTKRIVKVDIPVPIVDQREVAFSYFTQIATVERKRKNERGYHLSQKSQKSNTFLAWLGTRAIDSSATVVSGVSTSDGISASTGVCAAIKYATPNKFLVVNNEKVSTINERMKILETTGDFQLCTSLQSNNFRPMTKMISIEYDPIVEVTQPTRKGLIKQVDPIELIVAMMKGLSLDDKRKIRETEMEHFERFEAYKPYARPYAKRVKVSRYPI